MKELLKSLIYKLCGDRLIRRGRPGAVYITYDDGPHPENTEQILKILAKHGERATFFMVGESMEQYPQIVESVIGAGHRMGYHSYRHTSLRQMGLRELRQDMRQAKKLSDRFGYPLKLYRPPYGELTVPSFIALLFAGWKVVMWSRDSRDSYDSVDQVVATLNPENISDGEIILLHDDFGPADELLEVVLSRMRSHGIRFGLL